MPPEVKELFYPGVEKPDLAADYDVLGFDADHCLVKYNIIPLCMLMKKGMADDLVKEGGYPEELKEAPDSLLNICLNNSVWDIQNNTILELGEEKIVVNAFKGSRKLTEEEVVQMYGEERVFQHLEYPNKLR